MARQYTKEDEVLEIKSLRRIISAYLNYPDAAEADVRRYERSFKRLSPEHKGLLSHMPMKFRTQRRCISMNTYFIMNMLQAFEPPLDMSRDINDKHDNLETATQGNKHSDAVSNAAETRTCADECASVSRTDVSISYTASSERENGLTCKPLNKDKEEMQVESCSESIKDRSASSGRYNQSCISCGDVNDVTCASACCSDTATIKNVTRDWLDPSLQSNVPPVDVDKVRCIIRNIVRDWAHEGQKERDECYKPILEELKRVFPTRSKERPPACLVPGAGLGRLALEISCLGFISQGNEFSYYMMICSSFILNHTQYPGEWTISPWIHSNCNSLSDDDQLRPVSIPDILPASAGITEGFSMCGGDFVEVYNDESHEGSWDAVVTCFFLDTAHNIVEYIEIISKILKDGGIWINLGPLLYHFSEAYGAEDDMSVELSLEDVKKVAHHYGFVLEKESTIETTYSANPRSMMQNRYFAAFWTMKKISS